MPETVANSVPVSSAMRATYLVADVQPRRYDAAAYPVLHIHLRGRSPPQSILQPPPPPYKSEYKKRRVTRRLPKL